MRLLPVLLTASALYAQDSADAHNWLNQGVAAFRSAQYPAAVEAFQKALQLDPNFTTARLYLATAYMQQFIPGATSPQNDEVAARALENFQGVLAQDPANVVAIASIGSLYLNQKKWDEAQQWYERLVALQPDNADAYYTLGFIEWSRWYPVYQQARASIGMKPEDAGPIPDIRTRQNLKVTYQAVVERGISDMQRALELRPDYSDAMSYMNLLIRERADLRDTADEYRRDIAEADQWVQKALVTKGMKAAGNATPGGLRINVNGNVQAEAHPQSGSGVPSACSPGPHSGNCEAPCDDRQRGDGPGHHGSQRPSSIGASGPGSGQAVGLPTNSDEWRADGGRHRARSSLPTAVIVIKTRQRNFWTAQFCRFDSAV
jgi:hypothetical protein